MKLSGKSYSELTYKEKLDVLGYSDRCPECGFEWVHDRRFSWKCLKCGTFFCSNDKIDKKRMEK